MIFWYPSELKSNSRPLLGLSCPSNFFTFCFILAKIAIAAKTNPPAERVEEISSFKMSDKEFEELTV